MTMANTIMTANFDFVSYVKTLIDERAAEYIEKVKQTKGKGLRLSSEFVTPICAEINKAVNKYGAKGTKEANDVSYYFNLCIWAIRGLLWTYEREEAEKETLNRIYV